MSHSRESLTKHPNNISHSISNLRFSFLIYRSFLILICFYINIRFKFTFKFQFQLFFKRVTFASLTSQSQHQHQSLNLKIDSIFRNLSLFWLQFTPTSILNCIQSKNCHFNCFLNESLAPVWSLSRIIKHNELQSHSISNLRFNFLIYRSFLIAIYFYINIRFKFSFKFDFQLFFIRVTRASSLAQLNIQTTSVTQS